MDATTDNTRFVSLAEAARRVGLGVGSLRRIIARGQVPAYKPAGCRRVVVKLSELAEWMAAQRATPSAPAWTPSVHNRATCFVFRRRRKAVDGTIAQSACWYADIGPAGCTPRRIALGVTDRREAQRRAEQLLREMESGQADQTAALARPLGEWITQYAEAVALRSKAGSEWPYIVDKSLRALAREAGWERLGDISTASFERWQKDKAEHAASGTVNRYGELLTAMLKWLQGRGVRTPAVGITSDGRGVVRRQRRAMSARQQRDLLAAVAAAAPQWFIHYHLVLTYELRRGDIERLARGDIYAADGRAWWLGGSSPVRMHLHGSVTKSGEDRVYRLRDDTLALLAARGGWGRAGAECELVFPEGAPPVAIVRQHLEAAGIAFVDGRGRRIDFHALRHTAITHSGTLAGVSTRQRAMLAGHADPRTTEGYTHGELIETEGVIEAMPRHDDLVAAVVGTAGYSQRGAAGTAQRTVAVAHGGNHGGEATHDGAVETGVNESGPAQGARPRTGELGFETTGKTLDSLSGSEAGTAQRTGLARRVAAWLELAPVGLPQAVVDAVWDAALGVCEADGAAQEAKA